MALTSQRGVDQAYSNVIGPDESIYMKINDTNSAMFLPKFKIGSQLVFCSNEDTLALLCLYIAIYNLLKLNKAGHIATLFNQLQDTSTMQTQIENIDEAIDIIKPLTPVGFIKLLNKYSDARIKLDGILSQFYERTNLSSIAQNSMQSVANVLKFKLTVYNEKFSNPRYILPRVGSMNCKPNGDINLFQDDKSKFCGIIIERAHHTELLSLNQNSNNSQTQSTKQCSLHSMVLEFYCPTCKVYRCECCTDIHTVITPGTIIGWKGRRHNLQSSVPPKIAIKELDTQYLNVLDSIEIKHKKAKEGIEILNCEVPMLDGFASTLQLFKVNSDNLQWDPSFYKDGILNKEIQDYNKSVSGISNSLVLCSQSISDSYNKLGQAKQSIRDILDFRTLQI